MLAARLWLYSERGLMSYLLCHVLPCELDFVLDNSWEGGPKTPWWEFTAERKQTLAARDAPEEPKGRAAKK